MANGNGGCGGCVFGCFGENVSYKFNANVGCVLYPAAYPAYPRTLHLRSLRARLVLRPPTLRRRQPGGWLCAPLAYGPGGPVLCFSGS